MKKFRQIFYVALLLLVFLLAGCAGDKNNVSNQRGFGDESSSVSKSNTGSQDTNKDNSDNSPSSASKSDTNSKQSTTKDSNSTSSDGSSNTNSIISSENDNNNDLSSYSSKQIEYARVWLQLGTNQDIDELNVRTISAGTPLNPNDSTSATYPENVIQLSGSRLVDGSVTYSGNGNGTINVYNVPLRWDGHYPAGKKFYTNIIQNTKLVSINPGDNEKIVAIIKLMKIH